MRLDLPDDSKIYRFLDENGLKHTVGIAVLEDGKPKPNFLLRPPEHYRETTETSRADHSDGQIIIYNQAAGGMLTSTNANRTLISCWSCDQGQGLNTHTALSKFTDTIAVVESTVGDIKRILKQNFSAAWFPHGKINYYANDDCDTLTSHKHIDIHFCKRKEFSIEDEYRFMLVFSPEQSLPQKNSNDNGYSMRLEENGFIKKIYLRKDYSYLERLLHPYYENRVEYL